MSAKKSGKKGVNTKQFVLNCVPSYSPETDWTFEDAIDAELIDSNNIAPARKDLRTDWWKIDNQGKTGACVGYATAYGVLRWHYVKEGKSPKNEKPAARFIWMANKETDTITNYPSTFLDSAGTQTKLALKVARNFGCVPDKVLPMDGRLTLIPPNRFYATASRYRIASYHNLGRDLNAWRHWLAFQGPILTRLGVDRTWDQATQNRGVLDTYKPNTVRGGHAVCLVGYTKDNFIVRNSWGTQWGDKGFAYASNEYALEAFTEAFGAIL
jgi:hypothetical protein